MLLGVSLSVLFRMCCKSSVIESADRSSSIACLDRTRTCDNRTMKPVEQANSETFSITSFRRALRAGCKRPRHMFVRASSHFKFHSSVGNFAGHLELRSRWQAAALSMESIMMLRRVSVAAVVLCAGLGFASAQTGTGTGSGSGSTAPGASSGQSGCWDAAAGKVRPLGGSNTGSGGLASGSGTTSGSPSTGTSPNTGTYTGTPGASGSTSGTSGSAAGSAATRPSGMANC